MTNRISAFLFVAFSLLQVHSVFAQKTKKKSLWQALNAPAEADSTADDYYGDNALRYEDHIYRKNIRSAELRCEGFEISQPILQLGTEQRLQLDFDDLDADLKSYYYTILQCNENWEPSDLMVAEYIEGFTDNSINDHSYSINTIQKYTHYRAFFPNNSTRITKSGNYLLKVYLDSDPDRPVITKRFLIFDNKIQIDSRVTQASIIEDRNYKQELDFTINKNGYQIPNPYNDLKVVIMQNGRWDNIRTNLKPVFVKDDALVYDYDQENVFPGGNEFRYFDLKSIRYQTQQVYKIYTDSLGVEVELYGDTRRSSRRYYSQSDINGDFLIKMNEASRSEVEADYCYVHFFLPSDEVFMDGNLYVFGAYNNWACTTENLMRYNPKRFGYECTLYLKQGYYNYEYAFLKDGEKMPDETLIEGSHWDTENDYTILVYHRQQGTFYDQLIGLKHLNSVKN